MVLFYAKDLSRVLLKTFIVQTSANVLPSDTFIKDSNYIHTFLYHFGRIFKNTREYNGYVYIEYRQVAFIFRFALKRLFCIVTVKPIVSKMFSMVFQ